MSIKRMSFNETPDWLNSMGFIVRLSLSVNAASRLVTVYKGGLVYGFKNDNKDAHGFIVDNNETITVPTGASIYYLTINKDGNFDIHPGIYSSVRGIGANINGIPWYTYNNSALIGKIFINNDFISGWIVCDDPYWCEFEGTF